MSDITAEQATAMRAFLLAFIEAEHKATRRVFEAIPAPKLNVRPPNAAISIADFVWEIINAEHFFLGGICDGQFPENAPKASESRIAAILRWDDHCFAYDFRLFAELSGEGLVRRLDFLGGRRQAIELVPLYLSTIASYRGQLIAFLRSMGVTFGIAAMADEEGELSLAELAAVVGGRSPNAPPANTNNAIAAAALSNPANGEGELALESTLLLLQTAI